MSHEKKRPVNLDLFAFSFPVTAITSILHRVSGVLLFFAAPLYLKLLEVSLVDELHFKKITDCLATTHMRFITWLVLCTLLYHFLAGLRHLVMDLGFGESKCASKCTAKLLIAISLIVFIILGVWLW